MERRARLLLVCAFAALLLLIGLAGTAGIEIAGRIQAGEATLRARQIERSGRLERIRSDIFESGALARDYYADANGPDAGALLGRLQRLDADSNAAIEAYAASSGTADPHVTRLRGGLVAYWKLLEFMIEMAPRHRSPQMETYFRGQISARREAMARISGEIAAALDRERQMREADLVRMYGNFRQLLIWAVVLVIVAGVLIATVTARRLMRLERDAQRLAGQLVQAQEQERRSIARELHDEIGQSLTGLLLDIGVTVSAAGSGPVQARLREIAAGGQRIVEEVRRIALSLRPSMLDDLGLLPAIEWQAREVQHRSGLTIEVEAEASADDLPDAQRTCVYRVVQEALHNCARHAQARRVKVAVQRRADMVKLQVEDDGTGFAPARTRGLGLLGIEERVKQLGGRLRVLSEPGRGTTLTAELPV